MIIYRCKGQVLIPLKNISHVIRDEKSLIVYMNNGKSVTLNFDTYDESAKDFKMIEESLMKL